MCARTNVSCVSLVCHRRKESRVIYKHFGVLCPANALSLLAWNDGGYEGVYLFIYYLSFYLIRGLSGKLSYTNI